MSENETKSGTEEPVRPAPVLRQQGFIPIGALARGERVKATFRERAAKQRRRALLGWR